MPEQKEVPQPTAPATPLAPITALPMSPGWIEVEFTTGARLRIRGPVDVPIVAAVMQALTDSQGERKIDEAVPSGTPPSP